MLSPCPLSCFGAYTYSWSVMQHQRQKHKASLWERTWLCDFCLRVVSPDNGSLPCVVCNIVVHAKCLRQAVLASQSRVGPPNNSGTPCGTDPWNLLGTGVEINLPSPDGRNEHFERSGSPSIGEEGRVRVVIMYK